MSGDEVTAVPHTSSWPEPHVPWEFHCHGIGEFDFSAFSSDSLRGIEATAASEGVLCVLTMYLPRPNFEPFLRFMRMFAEMRRSGALPHIGGVALEGPMLGSFGGTPDTGVWVPERNQRRSLAECGPLGLMYIVISPDAWNRGSHLFDTLGSRHPSLEWVVETLWDGGVRPALGHFHRNDPSASAAAVHRVVELATERFPTPLSDAVLTDHLFNDMPVRCRYSWRTPMLQAQRRRDINELAIDEWTLSSLNDRLGPVPTALINAAHDGRLTACINFDGEHLDIRIAVQTVKLIGAKSVIAMTDRVDAAVLGGQPLHHEPGTSLWYQAAGVVAAGSSGIGEQIAAMGTAGLSPEEIFRCSTSTPARVAAGPHGGCQHDGCGQAELARSLPPVGQ